jgi:hypothetical protein
MAGSPRPVAVAEALGMTVFRVGPDLTFGAPGAILGRRIYVRSGQPPDDECHVVAELAALEAVEAFSIAVADPHAFAEEVADHLIRMGSLSQLRAAI